MLYKKDYYATIKNLLIFVNSYLFVNSLLYGGLPNIISNCLIHHSITSSSNICLLNGRNSHFQSQLEQILISKGFNLLRPSALPHKLQGLMPIVLAGRGAAIREPTRLFLEIIVHFYSQSSQLRIS
jgi:hypothetical protein